MSKELNYPKTEKFYVKDTIRFPHPYCIGPKHVAYAADNFGGMLGEAAIESGEKKGIKCAVSGCKLSYKEHEKALLIAVKDPRELKDMPELKDYLLSIKDQCIAEGYAGFAFIQESEG